MTHQLSSKEVDAILDVLPGKFDGFMRKWGFVQFGREVIGRYGMADEYAGAREDLEIWKKRALAAEAQVRDLEAQMEAVGAGGVSALRGVTGLNDRDAVLEEAAALMDQTGRSSGAALIRGLKVTHTAAAGSGCLGDPEKQTGIYEPGVASPADIAFLESAATGLQEAPGQLTPSEIRDRQQAPADSAAAHDDIGPILVGALPTMNQDDYPGLGQWWVQLRIGEGNDEVLARVYGASPKQADSRARALAGASRPAPPAAERAPVGDERAAFIAWLTGSYPNAYSEPEAVRLWHEGHVSALAWKERGRRAALASAPVAGEAQPVIHQHGFAADNQRLRAINESLDKQLEEVMTERDNREDYIDKLLDIVLGAERTEWSSEYDHGDALIEVEERMDALAIAAPQASPVAGQAEIMTIVREQCPDFDAAHEGPSEDDMISIARALLARYTAPQASTAADERDAKDAALLDWLRDESCDLRCVNVPTGGDDYAVRWHVVEHHMQAPHERVLWESHTDDPRDAIRGAMGANKRQGGAA